MTLRSLSSPTFYSLYVAFVLFDPRNVCKVSLYAHCHSLAQIPDISMVQYNIAILGGPLVTHVNVVFSVLELQGDQKCVS